MTTLNRTHLAAVAAACALVAIALEARAAHGTVYDAEALDIALEAAHAGEYRKAYGSAHAATRGREFSAYRAEIHAAVSALYQASQALPWKRSDAPLMTSPALELPIVELVREFGTIIVSGDMVHRPITAQDLATKS